MSARCIIFFDAIIMSESLYIDTGRMATGDRLERFCKWYNIVAAYADSIDLCSDIRFKLFRVYSKQLSMDIH